MTLAFIVQNLPFHLEGLRRILKRLGDAPFTIQQVATDRSPMIKTLMRREFSSISHQFDVWHFVKSVVKKLTKATKKKEMAILRKWIPSIANHLWWSASSCNGDSTQLRERWLSLLDHITNQHSWTGATKILKCAHGPLPPGQETQWLARGSPQHETLRKIVSKKDLLIDLEKLTDFIHTGSIEVYHSNQLVWTPKRIHFSFVGMRARQQLAALNHNYNVGRQQAKTQHGKAQWKIVFPKAKKKWVAKKVYSKKSTTYLHALMHSVYQTKKALVQGIRPECIDNYPGVPDGIPANIACEPRPATEDVIAAHISRFS